MKAKVAALLLLGAVILLGVQPVFAYPVTIYIEAIVDFVNDSGNYLEGKISPGSLITGYYTYESTTPDSSPADPVQGNYWHYSPPAGIFLISGGFNFQTDPTNVEFHVAIRNDIEPSGRDIYSLVSYNNLGLPNGTIVDSLLWQLNDDSGNALSSDALPITPPVLNEWLDFNHLRLEGDKSNFFLVDAHVTSAVPEPATLLLLGLGGIILRKQR